VQCEHDIYALPTVEFVGGSTQEFAFHAYFHQNNKPISLETCSAKFSILDYMNKGGTPLLSKDMKIVLSADGTIMNVLTVTLQPSETVNMHGKYIYQITISDIDGAVDIPKQGILRIIDNIDKKIIQ